MMTTRRIVFSLVGSGIACLLLVGMGQAQAPRVFVSINGSDSNPCSAVQPCRSFNQALTAVEAGGEIVVQSSGGYSTGFTITQGVTIDAEGVDASVISTSATDLCTINTTDRVVLRGISFHGANIGHHAINVTQVGSLYVEHCSIAEFGGFGVTMLNGGNLFFTETDVRKCLEGIVLGSGTTGANLVAHDSRFTECVDDGVLFEANGTGGASGSISNCTAFLCGAGGFLAESFTGATVTLALTNCRAFNTSNGFFASASNSGGANMVLTNCQALDNTIGITVEAMGTGNATVRIANCVVTQNSIGLSSSQTGSGLARVIGTSPGSNLIADNSSGNSTGNAAPLVLQ